VVVDSDQVRQEWNDRSAAYSPEYYAYRGPDGATDRIRQAFDARLGPDPAILEVGCSSGRHLAALLEAGYTDLTGIELNADARTVMAEEFPDLAATASVHYEAIEAVIEDFSADQFDAVFAVETLQHVHPDSAWVFAELARVTGDLLITVENEGGEETDDVNYVDGEVPLYYRDWGSVFEDLGLEQVTAEEGTRDTVRIFRA
jgi:SAM-dependent methyltransferase